MTGTRSRLMAVVTVLASVAFGVGIGILLDRTVLGRRPPFRGGRGGFVSMMTEAPDPAARERERQRIVARMTDELALTPAQATRVTALFLARETQLDSVRLRVRPQLDSLRDAMRASMDSVLTAEQRAKFAELRKRMEQRSRRGGGPPR
jgi:Spy/CpxP family protein refolding chaperone